MGALKPWHVASLGCCALVVAGIVIGAVLLVRHLARR